MREYELIIDEALRKGLFPTRTIPVNANWLWGALGFRIDSEELLGYVESDDAGLQGSGVDLHYNWPYPQFIVGERYNILIVRNALLEEDLVYQVNSDYTVIGLIATVDQLTYGQGTLMEIADFGEYLFMTNGVIMIHWDVTVPGWTIVDSSLSIPQMRTICNFKGVAVGGNVRGVWNGITSVWDLWHECNETFYIWSKIGNLDFTPGQDNVSGYRRCPYGGEVYNVRRLGNNIVGYSSKGITLLTPVSEPAVTFGFTELDDVGLINKGAIDGSLQRHIYVGSDYILREITVGASTFVQGGIKELGYYSFMNELEGEDIIVKYDRTKKDFYIGNSTKTFLLSPYGLTEIPQHPSALWTMDHEYAHEDEISMLPNTVDADYAPSVLTTIFDMGYRGQKTIQSIETDAIAVFEPKALVGWMNTLEVMGYTPAVPLNNEGIAAITASGSEFAVQILFKYVAENSPIKYIKVRYKMTDLRGIRGVYAPPLRGQ